MNLQDEAIERIEELIYGEEDQIWPESRDARGDARERLARACSFARGDDRTDESPQGIPRSTGSRPESSREIVDWADRSFILITDWPSSFNPGNRAAAGAEHYVWPYKPRWIKATFGIQDAVGLTPRLDRLSASGWILGTGDASAYLDRLRLANLVFGDDIVLHAVLSDEHGTLSVITSQPDYKGEPANLEFIGEAMENKGFMRIPSDPPAFYRFEDNIAVFDLHEANAVRDGDVLYVYDPIVCQPSGALLEAIVKAASD